MKKIEKTKYNPKELSQYSAIIDEISDYCWNIISYPENKNKISRGPSRLDWAGQKFDINTKWKIIRSIVNKLPAKLDEHVKKIDIKDKKIDDFHFLAALGAKRNWKEECAICLENKKVGITCGCGHTEIVIFRPCGHSMCMKCFVIFMEKGGTPLKQKIFECGDQTFTSPGIMETNLDTNFKCHMCRDIVSHTFDINYCPYGKLEDFITDDLISYILEDIAVITTSPKPQKEKVAAKEK